MDKSRGWDILQDTRSDLSTSECCYTEKPTEGMGVDTLVRSPRLDTDQKAERKDTVGNLNT